MSKPAIAVLLLTAFTLLGCGGEPPGADDIPEGCRGVFALETDTELPALEIRAVRISWIDDSTLAVGDVDDRQIVLLSARTGAEVRRLGREGGGAGEFRAISGALPAGDGYVVTGYNRVTRFDRAGREEGTVSLPGMIINLLGWDGRRAWVTWVAPGMTGPAVGWADPRSGARALVFSPGEVDPALRHEVLPGVPNAFLAGAMAPGGDIVVGQQATYRLTRFDSSGQIVGTFGRTDLVPVERSAAEQEEMSAELKRRFVETVPRLEGVDLSPLDRVVSRPRFHFTGLTFDAAGRLWAVAGRRTDSTALDIFAPNGTYTRTVTVAHGVESLAFRGPRVAMLRELTSGPEEGQLQVVIGQVRECGAPARRAR